MVLPGFDEVLIVLVLLVPGFFSFLLAKRFAAVGKKFSDFEKTIISIFLSLVDYVPFTYVTGLNTFEKIQEGLLEPTNLGLLVLIAGGIGLGVGMTFKIIFNRNIVLGDAWDVSFDLASKSGGSWVIVFTQSNYEYKGIVSFVGRAEDGSKEIVITKPKQIIRDKDGMVIEEMEIGKEMLFTERDIARISFFTEFPK